MTTSIHPHTIAWVTIQDTTWAIDWPTDPENENLRNTGCAAIFDNKTGAEIEVIEPTTTDLRIEAAFTTAGQVLDAALEWLKERYNPDGRLAVRWVWRHGLSPVSGIDSMPEGDAA